MGKGLPRSTKAAPPARASIVKATINVEKVLTFTGVTATAVFQTSVIGDLPEGNILLLGAVANLRFAGSGSDANLLADFQGDFAIGSAATADNALSGAEVDIVPATAIGPATAEVTGPHRGANATQAILDNTDGSLELNLNVLLDADEVTNAQTSNITVTGQLYLAYVVLGDD